jgi:hypothetical protein
MGHSNVPKIFATLYDQFTVYSTHSFKDFFFFLCRKDTIGGVLEGYYFQVVQVTLQAAVARRRVEGRKGDAAHYKMKGTGREKKVKQKRGENVRIKKDMDVYIRIITAACGGWSSGWVIVCE